MSIVQFYKSQVKVDSNLYPIPPGGASLNWNANMVAPIVAGNYWQINYIEGLQMPAIDLQVALLDGTTANCPIHATALNKFMTRSPDYQHDVLSGVGIPLHFFDGYSGFNFPTVKPGSFNIGGSKGDDVRFSISYMVYGALPASYPTPNTTPLAAYDAFTGAPIRFQSVSFKKNNAYIDGVYRWDISASNNLTPDLSNVGSGPQSVLPVDCNAGVFTAGARIAFQANHGVPPIANGDNIAIIVSQGAITTTFTLNNVIVQNPATRNVGTGRQIREYDLLCLGDSNAVGPLTIS